MGVKKPFRPAQARDAKQRAYTRIGARHSGGLRSSPPSYKREASAEPRSLPRPFSKGLGY